jgi:hypothetical protein
MRQGLRWPNRLGQEILQDGGAAAGIAPDRQQGDIDAADFIRPKSSSDEQR